MLPTTPCLPKRTALFALGLTLIIAASTNAQPRLTSMGRATPDPSDSKDATPLVKLTVGECIHIAHEKQPKLTALRASLDSANLGVRGLENARWVAQLTPGFKYRSQQAGLGVVAAQAELEQATHDVTQSVVWNYYTVIYAREQAKNGKEALDLVEYYKDFVAKIVNSKEGATQEFNNIVLYKLEVRLSEAKRLLLKAQAGQERAMAALREAMGVGDDFHFDVADTELPEFGKIDLKEETVVAHAQCNRGEVKMSAIAADVTRLEAYVQWSFHFRLRTQTFASGADLHSRQLPQGSKEGEYRPDAIGPEMPANLFGNRQDRTARAWALAARSQAVQEKTKNLVTLEAENGFIEYRYSELAMNEAKIQADKSKAVFDQYKKLNPDVNKAATIMTMVESRAEMAKGRAAYLEAVYQRIVSLANLERITGGGIKVNYPGR